MRAISRGYRIVYETVDGARGKDYRLFMPETNPYSAPADEIRNSSWIEREYRDGHGYIFVEYESWSRANGSTFVRERLVDRWGMRTEWSVISISEAA